MASNAGVLQQGLQTEGRTHGRRQEGRKNNDRGGRYDGQQIKGWKEERWQGWSKKRQSDIHAKCSANDGGDGRDVCRSRVVKSLWYDHGVDHGHECRAQPVRLGNESIDW
jgi:hypothetical protein